MRRRPDGRCAGRDHREPRTGRRRSERLGRSAREPGILERFRASSRAPSATRCAAGAPAVSPRPRSISPGSVAPVTNTDAATVTIKRSRDALEAVDLPAVRGRDRGRRPARDGRARALPGVRPNAHRLSVAADHRRGPAWRARLPRRRDHRLDGSSRLARDRRDRKGLRASRSSRRGSPAPHGARLVPAGVPTPPRRCREAETFRARVRESAARALALERRRALPPG